MRLREFEDIIGAKAYYRRECIVVIDCTNKDRYNEHFDQVRSYENCTRGIWRGIPVLVWQAPDYCCGVARYVYSERWEALVSAATRKGYELTINGLMRDLNVVDDLFSFLEVEK